MPSESDDIATSDPSPPAMLSAELASQLAGLDESELQAIITYAHAVLLDNPSPTDLLEEQPGEEILDVIERDGHTEVIKKQPCAEGCDECPHGSYLYRVRVQMYPNENHRR